MSSKQETTLVLQKAHERLQSALPYISKSPRKNWDLNQKPELKYSDDVKSTFSIIDPNTKPDLEFQDAFRFIEEKLELCETTFDAIHEAFLKKIDYYSEDCQMKTVTKIPGKEIFVIDVCYVERKASDLSDLVHKEISLLELTKSVIEKYSHLYEGKTLSEYYDQAQIEGFYVYLKEEFSFWCLNNNVLKAMGIGVSTVRRLVDSEGEPCLEILLYGFDTKTKWEIYVDSLMERDLISKHTLLKKATRSRGNKRSRLRRALQKKRFFESN